MWTDRVGDKLSWVTRYSFLWGAGPGYHAKCQPDRASGTLPLTLRRAWLVASSGSVWSEGKMPADWAAVDGTGARL